MSVPFLQLISIAILRATLNASYFVARIFNSRRNLVVFLSRQSSSESLDYVCLEKEYKKRGYDASYLIGILDIRHPFACINRALKEVVLLAKCKICYLDGYDPVVSLLHFKCEAADPVKLANASKKGFHTEYPCEPIVIQIWHAFGALKKFSYQSLGTSEGRSELDAKRFKMHRNYSWIICSGEACRKPFAEAFRYPIERILPLGRPVQDTLLQKATEKKKQKAGKQYPVILFAPTLRRKNCNGSPLKRMYQDGTWEKLERYASVKWAFHPIESEKDSAEHTRQLLYEMDILVTDYSSIVYEAYLLNKCAVFYTPDLDEYEKSPGINVNLRKYSEIVLQDSEELFATLQDFVTGVREYPFAVFEEFAQGYCDKTPGACVRIVDASLKWANK